MMPVAGSTTFPRMAGMMSVAKKEPKLMMK
jgi:hypothetical protein